MSSSEIPIVVVGYNRPESLARVLKSLEQAHYPKNEITLIISIDFSDYKEVTQIANEFSWNYGEKIVIAHKKNLGLKQHILLCGDYALKYGNVIILEDDLYVSPNFYFYTIEALRFSMDKEYIGGISLYNHKLNVHTKEYFNAIEDGYDNYYFQFASSWGQAWTKEQWENFKIWLSKNDIIHQSPKIPRNVTNWSDKSWLKFFIAFLIATNRYFFYPKISLTSNFSDQGTHVGDDSTAYQTELFYAKKSEYNFSKIEDAMAVYDSFYESEFLIKYLGYSKDEIDIDLYGYKKNGTKRFLATSKILNYRIMTAKSRSLKPLEANFISEISGNELFIYDLSTSEKNGKSNLEYLNHRRILYSIKIIAPKSLFLLMKIFCKDKLKRILKIK